METPPRVTSVSFQPKHDSRLPLVWSEGTDSAEGYHSPAHWHDCLELLYLTHGSAWIWLENQWQWTAQGTLIVLPPRLVHGVWMAPGNPTRHFSLGLEKGFFQPSVYGLPGVSNWWALHQAMGARSRVVGPDVVAASPFPPLVETLIKEGRGKAPGFELAANIVVYQMLLWLIRNNQTEGIPVSEETTSLPLLKIQTVFDHIDAQVGAPWTADELAALCGVTASYFGQLFFRVTGLGFKEYLTEVRLSEAEKLLITTDRTLDDIAQAVGYNDASYFIKRFRTHRNLSPGEYRAVHAPTGSNPRQ